ncbi:arsenate reductase ArsC [Phenylobacterium sp.]|uniref:arsenate reductase ArsC n=1 Tax=Phenylobacterium sp. TaxID=1871053 RepID=UPI0035C7E2C7
MADATRAPWRVLFLCTGNSARSILAEALLNRLGAGRFEAYSAGSTPKGAVHPESLRLLSDKGYDIAGLRSKSWDEFAAPGAPPLDLIITVCDNAAGEVCPIWPGRPAAAHWGLPDPAAASPADAPGAFARAYEQLELRISALAQLDLAALSPEALKRRLAEIHEEAQS